MGKRFHRLRDLQIVAAEYAALDCQRLRERRFRAFRISADQIMEGAELIKPVRERVLASPPPTRLLRRLPDTQPRMP
jgi:hypothetical protein